MNTPSSLHPPEIIIFFPGCAGDRGEGKSQFITAALLLLPPPHQKRWIVTNKLSAVSRRQKGIEEGALINLFSRICCINNGKERLFYAKWMCACSAFFPLSFSNTKGHISALAPAATRSNEKRRRRFLSLPFLYPQGAFLCGKGPWVLFFRKIRRCPLSRQRPLRGG